MEEYNNTSSEIANQLFEYNLDMDYLDSADCMEEELKMLADEIESIRQTHTTLSHALDLFATMYASECPLIERIRQFNEGV